MIKTSLYGRTVTVPIDNGIKYDIICDVMKILLDTNIIVAGLYSKRGASYQLLKSALSGQLSFAISPLVALEYEGVVNQKIEEGFLKISTKDIFRLS